MHICKKTLCRIVVLLCIVLMGYKLFCDSTYMYFCYLTGSTQHLTYILLAAAFVVGAVLVLFAGWCRRLDAKKARLAAVCLFAAMILVQLVLILAAFRYYLPWADALSVINESISMTSKDIPQITSSGRYFEMYGNNYFFTIFLYWYFRFFQMFGLEAYWMEALFLNMAAIDAGVFFTFASVRRLFGPSRALGVLALCVCNPVVYVFLPFVYTNTFSIPFTMGLFYLCICLLQSHTRRGRILLSAALAFLTVIGIQIRVTTLIPCIAIGIAALIYGLRPLCRRMILEGQHACSRSLLLPAAAFCVSAVLTFGFCQAAVSHYVPEELRSQNFPVTHWLMMGLGGSGGYSSTDEDFTYQFKTKEEKVQANLEEIKNRLEAHTPSSLFELGKTKFKETWTAQLHGLYLETGRMQGYSILQKYLFGFKNDLLIYDYQTFQVLLNILIIIGLIRQLMRPREQLASWVFTLTLFGFFLFYLIWEANCRYSICLTLLLCLLASFGVEALLDLPAFLTLAKLPSISEPRKILRGMASCAMLFAVILPCAYGMYRNLPQYTQPFIPKVDYSVIMVSRSYHEAAVGDIVSSDRTLSQTFTTAHPFNEIGVYVSYNQDEEWQDSMTEEVLYQFRLLDADGKELARQEFAPEGDSAYYKLFGFDLVTPAGSSAYTIEISRADNVPLNAKDRLDFLYFDFDTYDYIEGGTLSVDGKSLDRDMLFMVNYSYTGPYTTPGRYIAVCAALMAGLILLLLILGREYLPIRRLGGSKPSHLPGK